MATPSLRCALSSWPELPVSRAGSIGSRSKRKRRPRHSSTAVKLAGTGKADDGLKQLATVSHAGYAHLARLREAGILASQGKADEAVKAYDAVAADAATDPTLRDLAKVRAAYVLAESQTPDQLTARIGGFDSVGNPWRHAAREIIAIAAWRVKDYTLAGQDGERHFGRCGDLPRACARGPRPSASCLLHC